MSYSLKHSLLTEVRHRLENQNVIIDNIGNVIYNQLTQTSINDKIFIDLSKYDFVFKSIKINVEKRLNLNTVSAEIIDFDPLEINLRITKYWDLVDKSDLINKIKSTISHEMLHGRIYGGIRDTYKDINREILIKKINNIPDYYNNIIELIRLYNKEDIFYHFAYALYSTFFHEKQALINQAEIDIRNELFKLNRENYNRENVINILNNNEEYNVFCCNIEICKQINNMTISEQQQFSKIFNNIVKQNIIKENNLHKIIDYIEKQSRDAIKDINTILYDILTEFNLD